ncbi:MAG: contractile injection system tape measure protein [Methylobacter sp.]
MGTQRHVIKRQIVEISLAKKENAWELQQALSRIFQQSLPPLLDRCLSEASRPDCLHRIDRLELDLGELDSNSLEADILERVELSLRQALSEQIDPRESMPIAQQKNDTIVSHLELLEHFVREGYLPWWADNSQRQLPEKSFIVLLNDDPGALKQLLSGLIQESRCLQRLISYFDDSRLLAMTSLLTASKHSAASLVQTLSVVQEPLHQLSRLPVAQLRTALWQSLLQVAVAGTPVISSHSEFLTAVTVRWAKLQGLSHQVLVGCLQQLVASQGMTNNEWLQTVRLLSAAVEQTLVEKVIDDDSATPETLQRELPKSANETPIVSEITDADDNRMDQARQSALAAISSRYAVLKKHRFTRAKSENETLFARQAMGHVSDFISNGQHQIESVALSSRKAIFNHPDSTPPESMNESSRGQAAEPIADRLQAESVQNNNHAMPDSPDSTQSESVNEFSDAEQTTDTVSNPKPYRYPHTSASISDRYAMLKSSHSTSAQKFADQPLTVKQSAARKFARSSQPDRLPAKNDSPEDQAGIVKPGARSTFSDTEALYINNAGLCLLWPFLVSFFERLELVQNGRFHNQAAKQCGASLLHYLGTEELDPPEYLLPFNKLLCAMEIDEVFDLKMPLTGLQIQACDELLGAVIDHAPILNNMSVNGFRGSFLLRRGILNAGEGSWVLRVERETYDLVLERFPWSWQWFKLPWMEYPIRVEW